jgi:hypothetical protein
MPLHGNFVQNTSAANLLAVKLIRGGGAHPGIRDLLQQLMQDVSAHEVGAEHRDEVLLPAFA